MVDATLASAQSANEWIEKAEPRQPGESFPGRRAVTNHPVRHVPPEERQFRKAAVFRSLQTPSCCAPDEIDFLSIDTEGSEFDILNAFDFSQRRIRTITVEHNHTPARDAIHELLCRKGFVRKMESISAFDDWYVEAR
jgi:hypothetical protein